MNGQRSTLSILGAKGDTKLTWDPNDPADCERARKAVADLKKAGYAFFLTSGQPADEIGGDPNGTLIVDKLTAEEVVPGPPSAEEPPPVLNRRGRPPKNPGQSTIAVRPVRGG